MSHFGLKPLKNKDLNRFSRCWSLQGDAHAHSLKGKVHAHLLHQMSEKFKQLLQGDITLRIVYLLREISRTLALHCALDGAPRPAPGLVLHGVLSGGDVTAPSINLDSIKLKRRVASPHHSSRGRHIPEHAQFDFVAKHTLLL